MGLGTSRQHGYMPALDGIRGIAVLLVLACHLYVHTVPGGAVGVDIFFALSGFLITGILVRELDATGRIRFARFYGRRAIRLYPALALTLLLFLVPGLMLAGTEHARASVAAALYITPFMHDAGWIGENSLSHTWTLTVEECFYLVWPLVLVALAVIGVLKRAGWWVIGTGVLMLTANIMLEASGVGAIWELRAGGMLLGCGAAILATRGFSAPFWVIPLSTLGVAAGVAIWNIAGMESSAVLLTAASAAAAISYVSAHQESRPTRALSWAPLRWTGVISYELYLVHMPIIVLSGTALRGLEVRRTVWVVACAIASFAIAAGIHYLLAPLQRRLHRNLDAATVSGQKIGLMTAIPAPPVPPAPEALPLTDAPPPPAPAP